MGANPSAHFRGDDEIEIDIGGKIIVLQPNHPVENITWWSAAEFCNRLSKKEGLKPVYDFSSIRFKEGTSAEAGNLEWIDGSFTIDAPKGDVSFERWKD